MTKTCTGCHVRKHVACGLFFRPGVHYAVTRDRMCELHGDPEVRARYMAMMKEDQCE